MTESTLTNASRPPRITAIAAGIFAAALFGKARHCRAWVVRPITWSQD